MKIHTMNLDHAELFCIVPGKLQMQCFCHSFPVNGGIPRSVLDAIHQSVAIFRSFKTPDIVFAGALGVQLSVIGTQLQVDIVVQIKIDCNRICKRLHRLERKISTLQPHMSDFTVVLFKHDGLVVYHADENVYH